MINENLIDKRDEFVCEYSVVFDLIKTILKKRYFTSDICIIPVLKEVNYMYYNKYKMFYHLIDILDSKLYFENVKVFDEDDDFTYDIENYICSEIDKMNISYKQLSCDSQNILEEIEYCDEMIQNYFNFDEYHEMFEEIKSTDFESIEIIRHDYFNNFKKYIFINQDNLDLKFSTCQIQEFYEHYFIVSNTLH